MDVFILVYFKIIEVKLTFSKISVFLSTIFDSRPLSSAFVNINSFKMQLIFQLKWYIVYKALYDLKEQVMQI